LAGVLLSIWSFSDELQRELSFGEVHGKEAGEEKSA